MTETVTDAALPVRHDWRIVQGDDAILRWFFKTGWDFSAATAACQWRSSRAQDSALQAEATCTIEASGEAGYMVTAHVPGSITTTLPASSRDPKLEYWYDLEVDNWDGEGNKQTFFYGKINLLPEVTWEEA